MVKKSPLLGPTRKQLRNRVKELELQSLTYHRKFTIRQGTTLSKLYKSRLAFVELTRERKNHILKRHPDTEKYLPILGRVLGDPFKIRQSKIDSRVLIFYGRIDKLDKEKYLAVVVKCNKRKFILTVYLTKQILTGKDYKISK